MLDLEVQNDELLALSSIYNERDIMIINNGDSEPSGCFNARLNLPRPFVVNLSDSDQGTGSHSLHFLPPIRLDFELPNDYPSKSPPGFTLSCQWLTRMELTKLCRKLDEIWTDMEFCETLFSWTDFLQNETVEFLNLLQPLELNVSCAGPRKYSSSESSGDSDSGNGSLTPDSDNDQDCVVEDDRAVQDIPSKDALLAAILEYDQVQRREEFRLSVFNCDICFMNKFGQQCMEFIQCRHVYCQSCTRTYMEHQIADGNVADICCPHPKCSSPVLPGQVQALVSPDLFNKYDRLLLQSTLDRMSDVCYCPRSDCQTPVIKDSEESKLGQCSRCYYVFCTLCHNTYHGDKTPCSFKLDELKKIREHYKTATDAEREFLKKKYGAKTIATALEEIISLEWMADNAKRCPDCGMFIQKTSGCNKMTCWKCSCPFCYLCGSKLVKGYLHFNDRRVPCFGRLFEGVEGVVDDDDDDDDDDDFLGRWM